MSWNDLDPTARMGAQFGPDGDAAAPAGAGQDGPLAVGVAAGDLPDLPSAGTAPPSRAFICLICFAAAMPSATALSSSARIRARRFRCRLPLTWSARLSPSGHVTPHAAHRNLPAAGVLLASAGTFAQTASSASRLGPAGVFASAGFVGIFSAGGFVGVLAAASRTAPAPASPSQASWRLGARSLRLALFSAFLLRRRASPPSAIPGHSPRSARPSPIQSAEPAIL
mmetsp:Transcript_8367/g.19646  ORF Transcript_8367/g.19646 Transcript_8367/m.19646 type:complete len:226 (-) Transcript_8367:1555-2232(-)